MLNLLINLLIFYLSNWLEKLAGEISHLSWEGIVHCRENNIEVRSKSKHKHLATICRKGMESHALHSREILKWQSPTSFRIVQCACESVGADQFRHAQNESLASVHACLTLRETKLWLLSCSKTEIAMLCVTITNWYFSFVKNLASLPTTGSKLPVGWTKFRSWGSYKALSVLHNHLILFSLKVWLYFS